jgi:hypothetical protein
MGGETTANKGDTKCRRSSYCMMRACSRHVELLDDNGALSIRQDQPNGKPALVTDDIFGASCIFSSSPITPATPVTPPSSDKAIGRRLRQSFSQPPWIRARQARRPARSALPHLTTTSPLGVVIVLLDIHTLLLLLHSAREARAKSHGGPTRRERSPGLHYGFGAQLQRCVKGRHTERGCREAGRGQLQVQDAAGHFEKVGRPACSATAPPTKI